LLLLSNATDGVHYLTIDSTHRMRYGDSSVPAHVFTGPLSLAASGSSNAGVSVSSSNLVLQSVAGINLDTVDDIDFLANQITDFTATFNNQTGTTYTLAASDNGDVVTLNNASAITVTLPNNLAVGFNCRLIQLGAGQVTVSAAAGATVRNRQTQTKIAGQYGEASLIVTSNTSGVAAIYNFAGDTA